MPFLNGEKRKRKKQERQLALVMVVVVQVKQRKSLTLAVVQQTTVSVVLRYLALDVRVAMLC